MTESEIAVKLTAHDHEIGSIKHRLDNLEEQNTAIQNLTLSVRELTLNMTRMNELQEQQRADIEKLKAEPAEKWKESTKTIRTAIFSAIAGALATGIIMLIAQFI